MKTQFTPGPWHIWKEDIGRERTQRISGKDGFCLALAYGETEDETSSNARLIAAAPEMREALKRCIVDAKQNLTKAERLERIKVAQGLIDRIEKD